MGRFEDAKAAADAAGPSAARAALTGLADAELSLAEGEPEAALGALRAAITAPGFERRAELAAARAQYARGDLVRAQRLLDGLIRDDDQSFPALLLRARVALRSGDASRARTLAAAMLARDPGNVSAGAVAIEASLRGGDREAARETLRTLRPVGDDPRPAYLAALIAVEEGRLREAADAIAPIEGWLGTVDGGAVLIARIRADAGRLGQAEKVLRDRLRQVPGDRASAGLLIDVLDRAGKPDRADEVLEDALRASPGAPDLRALSAERLIARGQPDEGLAILEEIDPARAQLIAALTGPDLAAAPRSDLLSAYAGLRRGDTAAALTAARRAVEAERSAPALNILAAALSRSGDEAGARAALEEAVATDPDFLAPIANLAGLKGGEDALLTELEAARKAGADGAPVLMQLAAERFAAGDAEGAIEAAEAAAKTRAPEAALLLARLRIANGASASAGLVALANAHPDEPEVVMPAAALLESAGKAGLAAPALARLARLTGDAGQHLAAAAAAEAAGDERAAVLAARRAAKAAPDDPRAARAVVAYEAKLLGAGEALRNASGGPLAPAHARAVALDATGDRAGARAALLAAADGLDGAGLVMLLRLSVGTPDEASAITALSAHVDAYPGDVPALVALGAALAEAGRTTRAEDALRRALAAAPGDPIVLNNLADLRRERDPAGALAMARSAHARAPGVAAIAETYAGLLAAQGDAGEARRVLRRARLAAPSDPALARAERALGEG